jgi:hypothetical protein
MVEAPPECAHEIPVRAAVRVRGALVRIGGADRRQRGGRNETRRRKLDLLDLSGQLGLLGAEPELGPNACDRRLQVVGGRLLVLEAPAPELAPAGAGRGADRYQ